MNLFYVQADGDTFVRHIHDVEPTRWDEDNYCRVAKLTPEQVVQYGVHQLKLVTPPYFDPVTQMREEGPALLVDGVWTQNWITTSATPEEIAQREQDMRNANKFRASAELYETDYTDLPHTSSQITNIQDVLAYRQALRQIALAPPVTVQSWPVLPAIIWST